MQAVVYLHRHIILPVHLVQIKPIAVEFAYDHSAARSAQIDRQAGPRPTFPLPQLAPLPFGVFPMIRQ